MTRFRLFSVRLPRLVAVALLLTIAAPVQARSPVGGPEVRIGDNVLVVPDKRARSITGWLIVLAGCADEADGQCVGIAHYLEHLLFINRDNEHRAKVALFPDGSGNGWTTHRTTAYFQRFPSRPASDAESLDKLIGYFAGLLSYVKAEGPQAGRERNVVLMEYQQNTGRNPFARFGIELNRALMPDEPLGQRVIGSPETIRAFTVEAASAFHERWYARNNAFIVLHGPIEPTSVELLVARHIAALPAKALPPHVWKQQRRYEPGTSMLRTRDKDARQVGVYLDKIVTFDEPAQMRKLINASRGVLAAFLASRLQESPLEILMERDGLVAEARLSVSRIRDGALRLSFSGVPARGVAPEKVIDAARAYIAGLARTGLSEPIVDRLKLRISNERALLAEQPALYAQALTNWLAGHGTHADWIERQVDHEAVTADSVNRLLAIVAGPGREVVGVMMPETTAAGGAPRGRDGAAQSPPSEASPSTSSEP